jgi:flagellar biogenesis protein FliO
MHATGLPQVHGQVVPAVADQPVQAAGEKTANVPLSPRNRRSSLPLPRPGSSNRTKPGPRSGLSSVVTVVGSLALVLGIFFLVAWGMRRAAPAGGGVLPNEVFEVLGRAPLENRQQVHLLRCGNKLILVSVTAAGAETLTEITDSAEVDRLAGLCRQAHPNSATAAFRQVFGQFASGYSRAGLFKASDRDDRRLAGTAVPANLDGLENRDV